MAERSLATAVRELRLRAGLTLEELAGSSGLSVRAISDLERGRSHTPQRRTIAALADALGLSGDDRQELLAAARENRRQRPATETATPTGAWLPRVPGDFVGRVVELDRLRLSARPGGPPVVVSGPAGSGKSTLAAYAARSLAGDFPDGVLFVGLRGMADQPAGADEVLSRLLHGLGVPPDGLPARTGERAELYERLLAEKQALIVFDDAADEEHVRPYLGKARGVSVVTSRRRLAALTGVTRLELSPFSPAEAIDLLHAILSGPEGGPAELEPEAAAEVAALCGHLPLAMRIAGNRLLSRPGWTLRDLAGRLADEERRLDRLVAGDLRVTAAFALSYAQLSPAAAATFRRLSLVPGGDMGAALATVVAGADRPVAEDALDELLELGLLQSDTADRFHFHDLVRLFARARLAGEETAEQRDESARRMTGWLLEAATAAGRWYEGDGAPAALDGGLRLGSTADAEAWLHAEAGNWLAAMRSADRPRAVLDAAEAMHWFSDFWSYWDGWEEVFTLGRDAARALGDLGQEATQTNYLSWVSAFRQDGEEALRRALEALRLAELGGDRAQEAWALHYASQAEADRGNLTEAAAYDERAAVIFEAAGDYDAMCQVLLARGDVEYFAGRPAGALPFFRQVLEVIEDPGRPVLPSVAGLMAGRARLGIGHALWKSGRRAEAAAVFAEAGERYAAIGVWDMQAKAVLALGRVLREDGRPEPARAALRQAEALFVRTGMDELVARVREELAAL
ncbi:helix-turn-helix domain-containing protein [Actinoplanes sp. CA-054009]